MAIIISDEMMQRANITEAEIRLEIAILLYKSKRYSIGKAAEFAGIGKMEMHQKLAERKIPLNITIEDVKADIKALQNL